jgi:hypothetical protein
LQKTTSGRKVLAKKQKGEKVKEEKKALNPIRDEEGDKEKDTVPKKKAKTMTVAPVPTPRKVDEKWLEEMAAKPITAKWVDEVEACFYTHVLEKDGQTEKKNSGFSEWHDHAAWDWVVDHTQLKKPIRAFVAKPENQEPKNWPELFTVARTLLADGYIPKKWDYTPYVYSVFVDDAECTSLKIGPSFDTVEEAQAALEHILAKHVDEATSDPTQKTNKGSAVLSVAQSEGIEHKAKIKSLIECVEDVYDVTATITQREHGVLPDTPIPDENLQGNHEGDGERDGDSDGE